MSQNQVTNSSPLIVLQRIGHIDLIPSTLGQLYIPQAVRKEVFGQDPVPTWIEERTLAQPLAAQIVAARLGPGEREAIALALELRATSCSSMICRLAV
jgi:predicted nucleic acid-binding protein